ncbi:hypothetical protein P8C59_003357 [Phyllachora maydis]|uniref:Small ribosomal subunit protein mS29 n=1 Tax=Phyllachora maydis TaxID=1825666 RepID=A0AAD9M956_9PEZI|nr:hypothetical protein P8C59_003357 [Phyllachora maydis]
MATLAGCLRWLTPRARMPVACFFSSTPAANARRPPTEATPRAKRAKAPATTGKTAKAGNSLSNHIRAGKQMRFKNTKVIDRGKSPLPGERKAYRKRIVLRNDNALAVAGLVPLDAGRMREPASQGVVMTIPPTLVDQLRAVEAFKPTQTWGLFREPATLLRAESVYLAARMKDRADGQETLRLVITGDRIAGKSTVLLHAMASAFLNQWIVLSIPEAQELTTASTEYAPIPGTSPTQYMQPNYALRLIQALRQANEGLFSRLETQVPHPELSQHVPVGSSLLQLARSAREADAAWGVFNALWQELTQEKRPPMLLAVDGLTHLMKMSDYRSPAYEPIHAHDLALVRLFVDHLSGAQALPNGGAVVAAMSGNNDPRVPSVSLALAQREAEQTGAAAIPPRDPFFAGYDARVDAALASVEVLPVRAVSRMEARSLMEYWAASGLFLSRVDTVAVSERWALGGNGNLGEMERASLLTLRV